MASEPPLERIGGLRSPRCASRGRVASRSDTRHRGAIARDPGATRASPRRSAIPSCFDWHADPWGPEVFPPCLIGLRAEQIPRDVRSLPGRLPPAVQGGKLLEAVSFALVFGCVDGGLTATLHGAPPPAMAIAA